MLPKEKSNRIANLLEKLGLFDRCINTITDLKKIDYDKKINYDWINCEYNWMDCHGFSCRGDVDEEGDSGQIFGQYW